MYVEGGRVTVMKWYPGMLRGLESRTEPCVTLDYFEEMTRKYNYFTKNSVNETSPITE